MTRKRLAFGGLSLGLVLASACAQEARLVPLDASVAEGGSAGSGGAAGAAGTAGLAGAAGGIDAGDSSAGASGESGASGQGGESGQGDASPDAGEDAAEAEAGPPTCGAGTAECDGNQADPCETDLLTDAAHCGNCQRSCEGGLCEGGICKPKTLYAGESQVAAVAVDATHVYWTISTTTGKVKRAIKGGAGTPSELASGLMYPENLAVDGTWVFYGGGSANNGYLNRMTKTGGASLALCPKTGTPCADFGVPESMVMDAGGLYWVVTDPFEGTPGKVQRMNKDGLVFVSLATAPNNKSPYDNVAVDDDGVYATDVINKSIWKLQKSSSLLPEQIVTGVNGIRQVQAPGGDRVFYSTILLTTFKVWAYSKSGKTTQELAKQDGMGQGSLIADQQHVYACDAGSGAIYRIDPDGTGFAKIGTGATSYGCAALDDKYLYLRSGSQGLIARLPK